MKNTGYRLLISIILVLGVSIISGCGSPQTAETSAPGIETNDTLTTEISKETTAAATIETQETTAAPAESTATEESMEVSVLGNEFSQTMYLANTTGRGGGSITLLGNGSFTGETHAMYPEEGKGQYITVVEKCEFSGKFSNIEKVDEYSYSLELIEFMLDKPAGTEEITEDVHFRYTDDQNFSDGKTFILYAPEAPLSVLTEDAKFGWPGPFEGAEIGEVGCWTLYNLDNYESYFGGHPQDET